MTTTISNSKNNRAHNTQTNYRGRGNTVQCTEWAFRWSYRSELLNGLTQGLASDQHELTARSHGTHTQSITAIIAQCYLHSGQKTTLDHEISRRNSALGVMLADKTEDMRVPRSEE
jgi:hypothetical protein